MPLRPLPLTGPSAIENLRESRDGAGQLRNPPDEPLPRHARVELYLDVAGRDAHRNVLHGACAEREVRLNPDVPEELGSAKKRAVHFGSSKLEEVANRLGFHGQGNRARCSVGAKRCDCGPFVEEGRGDVFCIRQQGHGFHVATSGRLECGAHNEGRGKQPPRSGKRGPAEAGDPQGTQGTAGDDPAKTLGVSPACGHQLQSQVDRCPASFAAGGHQKQWKREPARCRFVRAGANPRWLGVVRPNPVGCAQAISGGRRTSGSLTTER